MLKISTHQRRHCQITFKTTPEQRKALEDMARKECRSLSGQIVFFINTGLEAMTGQPLRDERQ